MERLLDMEAVGVVVEEGAAHVINNLNLTCSHILCTFRCNLTTNQHLNSLIVILVIDLDLHRLHRHRHLHLNHNHSLTVIHATDQHLHLHHRHLDHIAVLVVAVVEATAMRLPQAPVIVTRKYNLQRYLKFKGPPMLCNGN